MQGCRTSAASWTGAADLRTRGEGFEPSQTASKTAGLPLADPRIVGSEGVEPSSHRLKGECVAVTPRPRLWSPRLFQDDSHRCLPCSAIARAHRLPQRTRQAGEGFTPAHLNPLKKRPDRFLSGVERCWKGEFKCGDWSGQTAQGPRLALAVQKPVTEPDRLGGETKSLSPAQAGFHTIFARRAFPPVLWQLPTRSRSKARCLWVEG